MTALTRLFQARTVAVFGGAWARNVIDQLQKIGFEGDIWPVHPTKTEIAGLKAYANVADLPAAPDASFIGVNRNLTPEILQQLAAVDAGGAVCFASGFAETSADDHIVAEAGEQSGTQLQARALEAAGKMPFLGPNCYGFVNYLDKVALWPDEHGGVCGDTGVAIITQSSNMAISLSMSKRGLPLAYLATAGNQAQLDMCDMAEACLADDRVTAIGLHIEGIANRKKLESLAQKARRAGKPIIALKVGKSDAAQAATLSHTASLAGSDASASALFHHLGIVRIEGLGAFVEALKLAHHIGPLPNYQIGSLSCSGGEASLIADGAAKTKLSFPELTDQQITGLSAALGPLVHLSNPLDYQTYIWGDHAAMTAAFTAMLDGPQSLSCLVLDPPRTDRCDDAPWYPARDCLIEAVTATGRPAVILSTLPETLTEAFSQPATDAGIVSLMGLEDGLQAIQAMADIGKAWQEELSPELWDFQLSDRSDEPELTVPELTVIDESLAKDRLAKAGLAVPKNVVADTSQDALLAVASEGLCYPLVVKGLGFAHKTEENAVFINIQDEAALREALSQLAHGKGVLVEEMITGAVAEMLVGIVTDPAHGPVLTMAEGGIYTELLDDKVTVSLPARDDQILAALKTLRCWRKLEGYRGKPGIDQAAFIAFVQGLSDFYKAACGDIVEIEMNPVICTASRIVAVDALIRGYEKASL